MKKIILVILALYGVNSCSSIEQAGSDNSKTLSTQSIGPDTLSFHITDGNNIVFKAFLDGKDSLDLFFDTGGTELVLKHTAIKERTSLLIGKNKDYQEENYVPLEGGYSLSLGNLSWDSLTIYPTAVGPEESDGHFGWNLFKDKVVELDYDKQRMIIHNSFTRDLENYSLLEIEYINTLFCIQGNIKIGDKEYPNRYLFDSGFQRAVILDKELRAKADFPTHLPLLKESILRNSAGTEFVNQVVRIDEICFGESCAGEVPVQLLSTPNPARFETHILGNELLKRFNTIFDFKQDVIYMKPNSLMKLPYKDAS